MTRDSVTVAFELILEEIGSIVSEVNAQGAAFLRNNDYPRAEESISTGKKLAAFKAKLDALKDEWVSGLDEPTRRQVHVEPAAVSRTITSAPKSSKTVLVVKFADGSVIYESKASETFAKAIKKFGLQRVAELGLQVNNFPLVSKQRSDTYTQTEIDSMLVMTHSNTESKREQLLKIARELNEQISVDIVPG